MIDVARDLVHPLEVLLRPQNVLQESVQGRAVTPVADHRERAAVPTCVLDLQRFHSDFSDPITGTQRIVVRVALAGVAEGVKRNVLSLTIPSYPPAGTLARYNNAGGCVAATHPARTISSFFRRARARGQDNGILHPAAGGHGARCY